MIFKLISRSIEEPIAGETMIMAVIELPDRVVIFEFKLDGRADKALQQVEKTKYYQKYQHAGKEIELVGVNFDSRKRTVDAWETKTVGKEVAVMFGNQR